MTSWNNELYKVPELLALKLRARANIQSSNRRPRQHKADSKRANLENENNNKKEATQVEHGYIPNDEAAQNVLLRGSVTTQQKRRFRLERGVGGVAQFDDIHNRYPAPLN